jgi:hypothetical protein
MKYLTNASAPAGVSLCALVGNAGSNSPAGEEVWAAVGADDSDGANFGLGSPEHAPAKSAKTTVVTAIADRQRFTR